MTPSDISLCIIMSMYIFTDLYISILIFVSVSNIKKNNDSFICASSTSAGLIAISVRKRPLVPVVGTRTESGPLVPVAITNWD